MKWTNKGNFPEAVVKAVTSDGYSKGGADFSVTELISPPQLKKLQKLHSNQLTKDISENIWMLLGTAVHYILEQATEHPLQKQVLFMQSQLNDIKDIIDSLERGNIFDRPISEQIQEIIGRRLPTDSMIETEFRASINLGGYIISGAVDWYHSVDLTIEDYKVVTTWKFINNDWEDYTKQLNMYKYLFADNGRPSKTLRINAVFKDWKAREKGKEGYPEYPVMQIEVPVWDSLDTLQYMLDRIRVHAGADKCKDADELAEKFPCTDEDRWASRTYAIVKKGAERASWKFDTRGEALIKFGSLQKAGEYKIEDRSVFKRCEEYCDVSIFCKQFRKGLPTVHLGDAPRGIIKGEVRPELIVKDDFGPELRGENKSIEETRDAKVIVSDPQEEHIATITAIPKDANYTAEEVKELVDNPKPVIVEKETTAQLIARIKNKTEKSVAKVNEEHGHKPEVPTELFKTEDITIKSDKKEEPTKIDINADLGSILGEIGL